MDFSAIDRHDHVMLQFSGGKDSLAVLELCKPWWSKIFVVYCNPGDEFPETLEVVESIKKLPINFIEVTPEVKVSESIEQYGLPSDLIPLRNTYDYSWLSGMAMNGIAVQHPMNCCSRSRFEPLQKAIKELGITLIIRGQKVSQNKVSPVRNGDVIDCVEYLFPLQDFSEEGVLQFLRDSGVTIPEYYSHVEHSLDCVGCTAFLDETIGKIAYMKEFHPESYQIVSQRLKDIKASVDAEYQNLIDAVNI